MLMAFLRKQFIARLLMFGVAVVFIIGSVFIYTGIKGGSFFSRPEIALKVNDDKVTQEQYQNALRRKIDQTRQQYGENFTSMSRNMDFEQQTTNELVQQILLAQQVDAFKIDISDREFNKAILEEPRALQMYQIYNSMGEADSYRESFKETLGMQRLVKMLSDVAVVTDSEIEQEYRRQNEKAKLKYIEFSNRDFQDQVSVTDEQIAEYYEKHKKKYKKGDQVDIEYLKIDPKNLEKNVSVSDAEINNYYTLHKEKDFTEEEQVKARHILLKVEADASEEAKKKVEEKAGDVLKEAQKPDADFAALAEEYSEDPGSAKKGGDLGFFGRGRMVKEFEEVAFGLEPGKISDLVESTYGYHIIKVEEKKEESVKTLDEVRIEIQKSLAKEEAIAKAKEMADELLFDVDVEGMEAAAKLEKYKELLLDVSKTGFFSKDDSQIPTIGSSWTYQDLIDKVFELPKGYTSEVIEITNYSGDTQAYFIAKVIDKKLAHIPKLEDEGIKDDVTNDIKDEEAKKLAVKAAQSLISQRTENENLEDLAKKYKPAEGTTPKELKVKETQLFPLSTNDYVSGMGRSKEAMLAAFAMEKDEIRGPLTGINGSYIVQLVERQDFDPQKFQEDEKERIKIRGNLLQQKKNQIFQTWYEGIKARAEIVVNQKSNV
ncbi:peptidylprolyl isomerase [bacterium]|nr:peptidylprolyl isomerase [bacterium]